MEFLRSMNIQWLFNSVLQFIINILVLYIIVVLIFGLGQILFSFASAASVAGSGFSLSTAVTDILTFLVMIELFKGFIEYFKARRFRLHSMLDPAIIFIVRELIVKLYSHDEMGANSLFGFAALILSLGLIRTMAVCFSPREE